MTHDAYEEMWSNFNLWSNFNNYTIPCAPLQISSKLDGVLPFLRNWDTANLHRQHHVIWKLKTHVHYWNSRVRSWMKHIHKRATDSSISACAHLTPPFAPHWDHITFFQCVTWLQDFLPIYLDYPAPACVQSQAGEVRMRCTGMALTKFMTQLD